MRKDKKEMTRKDKKFRNDITNSKRINTTLPHAFCIDILTKYICIIEDFLLV